MTDSNTLIIIAAISAVPATAAAVLSFLTSLHAAVIREKMTKLEENTNSKMDRLVEVVATAEFAKGKLEGATGTDLSAEVRRQEKE